MGSDKALLAINQLTAIERQCKLLESVCPDGVFIAGARSKKIYDLNWPVIQDPSQDQGPLAGIVAALQHAQVGIAMIIAVDLVALEKSDLEALTHACSCDVESQFDVFYAHSACDPSEKGAQPLCAAWRIETSCPLLTEQFLAHQRSVMKAWLKLKRHGVSIDESRLLNINSPNDYERFQQAKG